jgi:peptide/nickel transport system permease protein
VTSYILRRLVLGIIVLFIATILVFVMMHMLPGDPLLLYLGEQYLNYEPEQLVEMRAEYGLDQPMIVQYFDWLGGVIKGDLGRSINYQQPVSTMIKQRLPVTLNLAVLALIVSTILGPAFGVIAAIRRGRWQDTTVSVLANLGITLPVFWVGIVLMYLFAYKLRWLPTFGYTSPADDFSMHVKMLILPVLCLSMFGTASQTRQARSSMLEVAHQDYIRTAWSKGLRERVVVLRHMLKNGLIPVITTMGMQVSFLFGGAVLVEKVFNIPGIGRMLAEGVTSRDYQVVQGGVVLMAVIIVLTNILVDIAYAWVDPRIRHSYR